MMYNIFVLMYLKQCLDYISVNLLKGFTFMKTKKAFFCIFFAVLIAVSQSLPVLAAVWNGSAQEPNVNGEGAYVVNTPEKLKWISNRVNSGDNNIDVVVTADLQLNATGSTANEWVPIGTSEHPFLGRFNGGNHIISGLYINNPDDNYQGLFGYIGTTETITVEYDVNGTPYEVYTYTPSEISYVVLENVNIKGSSHVGGVAGYSLGGSVKYCSVSGTVWGTTNVGGILGYNRKMATVENCLNTAAVKGNIRVGGIVGYNFSNADIEGCCNSGIINASSYVGGLVGTSSGSTVAHSYNKGTVNAEVNQAGGLIGYAAYGDIFGNYTLGSVNCPGELTGIAFGNVIYLTNIYKCYYDKDNPPIPFNDDFASPAEHVLMLDEIFVGTLNVERDIFVTDYFVVNDGYPILRWQLDSWTGDQSEPATDGAGVYLIGNGSELAWFAALVNGTLSGIPANPGANARLTKDILLNPDIFNETSNIWTPIGSLSNPYTGSFDGTMHRVRGIYINNTNLYYAGLFGYVGAGGSISNLYTENSSIKAGRYVSVTAGYNDGTITNCHNSAKAEASYYNGGIVGENHGTVSGCSNKGSIKSSNYAGGIVGRNYGLVESCYNNGIIDGTSRSGGIAGANHSIIRYVYSKTGIKGGNYVGGIVGELSGGASLNAAYSYGLVTGIGSYTAAVVGSLSNSTASYCYFNADISGVGDSHAMGLTTEQMSASTSITVFSGFSGDSWAKRTSDMYFNYCPELRAFYDSDDLQIKEASKQSVKVLKPDYVVMDEVDGEMNTYYTTLSSAANHIGTREGKMVIIGNCELSNPVTIAGKITITGDGIPHTVHKTFATAENMFNITGILTIDAANNSTDSAPLLTFDGGRYNALAGISAFRIAADGTLNLYKGTKIINTQTTEDGGAIYNNGGKFNMYGGVIENNITLRNGGGLYNNGGIVNITGGIITGNTAQNGGGIYFNGAFAEVNIEEVTISANNTTIGSGGGIYNNNSTVYFKSGTIEENSAYLYGGGLYNSGTFDFSGGKLEGNTVDNLKGSAIYQNGVLNMSADALVESDNSIYLVTGKTVTNTGKLLRSGVAAHLFPQNFTVGANVLSGDYTAVNYANFVADPQDGETLYINSSGNLVDRESANVCVLYAFGGESIPYTSVKEAVEAAGNEWGSIKLISDDIVVDTITVSGNIRIFGDGIENRSLTRYYTCEGDMFNVLPGASLELGSANTDDNSELTVDGSYTLNGLTGGAVVRNSGRFTLNDGATIANNFNSTGNGGAVYNEGVATIAGGNITGCQAAFGGAVYSVSGAEDEPGLILTGGLLNDNNATENGGAVAVVGGTYAFSGGAVSENVAENGGGIFIGEGASGKVFDSTESYENGTVTLYKIEYENGEPKLDEFGNIVYESFEQPLLYDRVARLSVTENTAAGTGGGILVSSGSIDLMGGNIAENTAENGGGIAVTYSGEAAFSSHSAVELAVSYHFIYDENNKAVDIEYEKAGSVTECSVSANNATKNGGGIYIDELSAVDYTVCMVSLNTAAKGSGVYVAGSFTMNADSSIATDNDVYLSGETVVNLGGAYSAGTEIIAELTISSPFITREMLTGIGVADVNERFVITNDEYYFITDDGLLDTASIMPTDDSPLTIDRESGVLTGIPDDRSVSAIVEGLVNSTVRVFDTNGVELDLNDNAKVTTNYTIVTEKNGVVIDTVTISYIGDLTCDGDTDGEDANMVSYLVAGILDPQELTAAQHRAADANNDGEVDVNDVLLLEQCGLLKATVSQTN